MHELDIFSLQYVSYPGGRVHAPYYRHIAGSSNLADLVMSQSIGLPIDCDNIALRAILACAPLWAAPDRGVAGED